MTTEPTGFGENTLIKIASIKDSELCYNTSPDLHTGEYYNYCLRLLSEAVSEHMDPVNVVFGDIDFNFENNNPTLKIDIQPEHTLVKAGGRSVEEVVRGTVKTSEEDNYLVRIPNFDYYSKLDATIEYSIPNIKNIQTAQDSRYLDYGKTAFYIAPMIYSDIEFDSTTKTETVTLFSDNPSDRRSGYLKESGTRNIKNVFSKEALRSLYYNSKILVNIHQTDHHHTFEELRVLPALCNGVVIVSEDVPLRHKIAYSNSIVWSSYEDLPQTVAEVQTNYDEYYHRIFTDGFKQQLHQIEENNKETFKKLLCLKIKTI